MSQLIISPPKVEEIPTYYRGYVAMVPKQDLLSYFSAQVDSVATVLGSLTEEQQRYRYAPEKWSIKDVAQHIIDSERIFSYRALRFARNDMKELAGFEENDYAASAHADRKSGTELIDEYNAVRGATIKLFQGLSEEELDRKGTANKQAISVRTIGYVIAGHELHHLQVIRERYL